MDLIFPSKRDVWIVAVIWLSIAALTAAPRLDVFRTDQDGRVVIETDGERISTWSQR